MNIMTVQTGGPITGIRSVARAAKNIARYGHIFTRVEEGCSGGEKFFGGACGFERVDHGHEFVHLGDDPALFGERASIMDRRQLWNCAKLK
jgi:hypothetical protein